MATASRTIQPQCNNQKCPRFWDPCCFLPTQLTNWEEGQPVDYLFVGIAGGKTDYDRKLPFVGDSGKILRNIMVGHTISASASVAYSNVCRCRPTNRLGENRDPTAEEVSHCLPFLLADIKALQPRQVVLMGKLPARVIAGVENLAEFRGRPISFQIDGQEFTGTCTYHPAQGVYNPNLISTLRNDVARLVNNFQLPYVIPPKEEHHYQILDTVEKVQTFTDTVVNKLTPNTVMALDLECWGLGRSPGGDNRILTSQWSWDGKNAFIIPYLHPDSPFVDDPAALRAVAECHRRIASGSVSFGYLVGHNLMFENGQFLREWDVPITSVPLIDTHAGRVLLDENLLSLRAGSGSAQDRPVTLKQIVDYDFGFDGYKTERMKDALVARNSGTLWARPLDLVAEYGGLDATTNWHVFFGEKRMAELEGYGEHWWRLLRYLFSRGIKLFSSMEYNGFYIDQKQNEFLRSKQSPILQKLAEIQQPLRDWDSVRKANALLVKDQLGSIRTINWDDPNATTGGDAWLFNLNKPAHQKLLFFDVMGLKPISKSDKTGEPSVDKEFQAAYEDVPEVKSLGELQYMKKLRGTYVTKLAKHLSEPDGCDGRIRPHFGISFVVSGRTNSWNPSMQNVPRGSDDYRLAIRRQFSTEPGRCLLSGDYMTNEVRVWGIETGDDKLAELFMQAKAARMEYLRDPSNSDALKLAKELGDTHTNTASLTYEITREQVTKDMRQATKAIVFGSISGRSVAAMAEQVGCSVDEMREKYDRFMAQFPTAAHYKENAGEICRANGGFMWTRLGRKRRLPAIFSGIDRLYREAARQAGNNPTQGTASDLAYLSVALFYLEYIQPNQLDWKIVNTVHDSMSSDLPIEHLPDAGLASYYYCTTRVTEVVKEDFGVELNTPIDFELEIGKHLGEKLVIEPIREHLEEARDLMLWREAERDRTGDYPSLNDSLQVWPGRLGKEYRAKKAV